jgi:hypothetical protein
MSAASRHIIETVNQHKPPTKVAIGPIGYMFKELQAAPIIKKPVAIHLRYLSIIFSRLIIFV